jgi:NADH-quinone oxidoreductase subunit L
MLLAAIVFLPLLGAISVGLTTRLIPKILAQILTTALVLSAAVAAGVVFFQITKTGMTESVALFQWMSVGAVQLKWQLYADTLTALMLVVVTFVASLVHVYAIGYMHDDPHISRFMAYLSLFTFFMLVLVTSANFLQLFVGWEGVGLCSYLLIGFWYEKDSANKAAMKAFIVNRVGDFSLILGLAGVFVLFGTLEFADVFAQVLDKKDVMWHLCSDISMPAITVICLLLFIGCMGKSAQIGLHIWLPDAMEGPTPVSALIHAATMVTAGVFLVARCSPLFEYAPMALLMITVVGAITSLFAGLIGTVQNDIKRIIAYSTCSQLGYMFMACGVSAYAAGMFHLTTHAFFKALLFLGAGSVIHAVSGQQDIFKMGGLWRKIPFTYAMMWVGSLALAGIMPFAGFYSKDSILESVYAAGGQLNHLVYFVGVFGAFLTAFYSWRLLIVVFHGTSKLSKSEQQAVHESPLSMTIPLALLSVGAVFAGAAGYYWLGIVDGDGAFWHQSIFVLDTHPSLTEAHHVAAWVKYAPLAASISGILMAGLLYQLKESWSDALKSALGWVHHLLSAAFYVDCIYHVLIVKPYRWLSEKSWKMVDEKTIDRCGPLGLSYLSKKLSQWVSCCHTGLIYHYAFVMLFGVTLLFTWYLWYIEQQHLINF